MGLVKGQDHLIFLLTSVSERVIGCALLNLAVFDCWLNCANVFYHGDCCHVQAAFIRKPPSILTSLLPLQRHITLEQSLFGLWLFHPYRQLKNLGTCFCCSEADLKCY